MSTIRKTKLFLSFAGFIIIIVSTAAHTIAFRESPLKNEMNLNDLQKNDIKVKYIEHSSSWDKTFYEKFASDILGAAKECDYVFLVQPTEKIYFNTGVILQQVRIIRQFSSKISDEYIWIHNGLNCSLDYRDGCIVLSGMDRSFMQEDCEYLVFCEKAPINKYSQKKVYREAEEMWIGCFNVSRDSTKTVEGEMADYDSSIEYYSDGEDILKCYMKAKHQLMKRYYY